MARTITASNATAGVAVPEDVYKVEVVALLEKQLEWDGQMLDKIEITFRILDDPEYEGVELRGMATLPARLTPKTKLRGWIQTIIGRELGDNEPFDLDTLIGKTCRVRTVNVEGKKGGTFSNVQDLLVARAPRNGGAPAPVGANY